MIKVIKDLVKYDRRFRVAAVFLSLTVIMVLLSFVSPHKPNQTFVVALDAPPSLEHPFGTTSRGQDLFWWMTLAVRNSLLLGILTAAISRVIAIAVGLAAGYRGGWADRVLMSVNDSFVVMPLLPILILLSFLFRGQLNVYFLALLLGIFGWPWDARLIRAQTLSLKQRAFTQTAVYTGAKTWRITLTEHLPFVLPIVFATSINNMLWSMGMEVTLSVLGLSDLSRPTIGTSLYWANQHGALVAGTWWWIGAPVLVTMVLFVGLYMLMSSVNEYIDPRTRLRLIGA